MPTEKSAPRESAAGFFHIELRPAEGFSETRTEIVDKDGRVERVAARNDGGDWETRKWLISKRDAHVEQGRLIADSDEARKVLDDLDSVPEQINGDHFRAKPRRTSAKLANARAQQFAQRMALEKNEKTRPKK